MVSLQFAYESSSSDQIRSAGGGADFRRGEAEAEGERVTGQGSRDHGESDGLRFPGGRAVHREVPRHGSWGRLTGVTLEVSRAGTWISAFERQIPRIVGIAEPRERGSLR